MSVASSTFRALITRSYRGIKYLWRNRNSVAEYLLLMLGKPIQTDYLEPLNSESEPLVKHYNTYIKPLITELELRRISFLKFLRIFSWLCALLIFAFIYIISDSYLTYRYNYLANFILPALILLNILGLIYLRYTYTAHLKKDLLPKILSFFSDDIEFFEHPQIDITSWHKYGILPEFYKQKTDDGIIGNYQGVEFNLFEAELIAKRFVQNEEYEQSTFNGIIATVAMNKRFKGQTIVYYHPKKQLFIKSTIPKSIKGMEIIHLEDPIFDKKFEVFSTDQIEARYLLTPTFMENLLKLNEIFGGTQLECSFLEEKLFLMINSSEDYFEPKSIFKPINFQNDIKPLFDEINSLLQIITTLKLNQNTRL